MKIRCPKWCMVSLPKEAVVVIAASVAGLFAGFGTFFLRSGMARIAEILGVPLRIELLTLFSSFMLSSQFSGRCSIRK